MTETDWLTCDHPYAMLEHVKRTASDRKRRLFATGCCRRIWPLIPSCFHEAVDVAEAYGDGLVTNKVRKSLEKRLRTRWQELHFGGSAAYAALECLKKDVGWHPGSPHSAVQAAWGKESLARQVEICSTEFAAQAALLRDIIGNPFYRLKVDLAYQTPTVTALATGIYAEQAHDRLPILADALQEAGCEDRNVLDHCRGDGPHARGCWVVDLVLGKD